MRTSPSRNGQVLEEAAEWLIELRESGSRGQAAARFLDWLRASPEHITAYFEMAALWEDIPRLVATENVDVEALVASAIPQQQRARTVFRPVAWAVALVACIGLGIAGWPGRSSDRDRGVGHSNGADRCRPGDGMETAQCRLSRHAARRSGGGAEPLQPETNHRRRSLVAGRTHQRGLLIDESGLAAAISARAARGVGK